MGPSERAALPDHCRGGLAPQWRAQLGWSSPGRSWAGRSRQGLAGRLRARPVALQSGANLVDGCNRAHWRQVRKIADKLCNRLVCYVFCNLVMVCCILKNEALCVLFTYSQYSRSVSALSQLENSRPDGRPQLMTPKRPPGENSPSTLEQTLARQSIAVHSFVERNRLYPLISALPDTAYVDCVDSRHPLESTSLPHQPPAWPCYHCTRGSVLILRACQRIAPYSPPAVERR